MAGEILLYTPLVAAACMFALAGWLAFLNFRSPVNRSFAVFLVLVGMTRLLNGVRSLALSPEPPAPAAFLSSHYDLSALRDYYQLAIPFALAYFLLAYSRPDGGPAWLWSRRAILLAAGAAEVAYSLDHGLLSATDAAGHLDLGPLALLSYGAPLAYAIVAMFLAVEASRDLMAPKRAAAFLVSTGLALVALVEAGIPVASVLVDGTDVAWALFTPSLTVQAVMMQYIAAVGLALAVPGIHLVGAARRPSARRKVMLAAALYPLAASCALFLALGPRFSVSGTAIALVAVWRILLPALVAYALVRHRLFGIDHKIKWTISRGTIAVAFLALFFTTSKVVENLLNEGFGLVFGGVSAGLLLFALSPLEKFGHRIAHAVLPNAKSPSELGREGRLRLFEEQAILVWSDGMLGRRERRLLDNLRDHLGIAFEDAARLEHAAALARPAQRG